MATTTDRAALELDTLCIGYDGHVVVENISLTLRPGGLLCLIGTNGSGKSTLLKTLAGLLEPIAGSVQVLGGAPGAQPARVGYLSQHPARSFTLPLRAADVVAMGRFASLGLLRRQHADDRRWCAEAIERMGVGEFADRPLMELSGGQRQRAHLGQALARHADVLLLDEPTAGLDPLMEAIFREHVLEARAEGRSVLLSSHVLAEVEKLCDRVTIIRRGRTVETGSLDDLRHLTRTSIAARTVRPVDDIGGLPGVHDVRFDDGRVRFDVDGSQLDTAVARLVAAGLQSLTSAPPTLEELFLRHYGDELAEP